MSRFWKVTQKRLEAAERALRLITEADAGYHTWGECGDYGAECGCCEAMHKIAADYFQAYPISKEPENPPVPPRESPQEPRSPTDTGKDKG